MRVALVMKRLCQKTAQYSMAAGTDSPSWMQGHPLGWLGGGSQILPICHSLEEP